MARIFALQEAKLLRFVLTGLLRQGLSHLGGDLYMLRPVELVSGQVAVHVPMRTHRGAPFLLGTFAALYGNSLRALLQDPACRPWVTFLWEDGKEFMLLQLQALLALQAQQLGASQPASASSAWQAAQQGQAPPQQAAPAAAHASLPASLPLPLPLAPGPLLPGSSWEDDQQQQQGGGSGSTGGLGAAWDAGPSSIAGLHGSEAHPSGGLEHSGGQHWGNASNNIAVMDPVPQEAPSPPPASVAADPEEPALWQEGAWAQVTFEGEQLLPRWVGALQQVLEAKPGLGHCTELGCKC